ncbi:MAG: ATP-dependent helicase [Candidatus Coproplasma sp.]
MSEILDTLNEEQVKPVKDTEGKVLVLAGAGSGKTRVLTARIAYILENRLSSPAGILAITFTNKAAKEMKERMEKVIGDTGDMWICTIHSMCVRILRRFGSSIGIIPNFSIYTESERTNVIKKLVKEVNAEDKILKSVKYHIANAKMLGLDPDQYETRFKNESDIKLAVEIYEKYNEYLQNCNALDFDDLLVRTLRLLRKDKEALEYLSDKFKYILVDEFQDTNAVQYNIIRLLASKHGNLFAVGDDDQSIYGWRGAEIGNILRFDKDYPEAKIYKLERNYRSTKSILSLANSVIAKNSERHKKTLWTDAEEGMKPEYVQSEEEKDEALFTAKTINSAVYTGDKYSDFAVLMRINALTRSYEQEFAKYGIPYKVFGGFKFFERKEIKDVLAYLRLISNPFDDEAFTRIINVPKRGIGGKTLETMEEYAKSNGLSLFDACIDADYLSVTPSAKAKLKEFANLLKKLVLISQTEGVSSVVKQMIELSNIKSAYDDKSDDGDVKLANIDEFLGAVDDFVKLNPNATLDEYLNQVSLSSDTDEMNDGNYVTLATIHSVKGLEFNDVFLCGLEDGILPTSRAMADPSALEEERRLTYVAITRAKRRLWITRSKSRFLYGRREATIPSRFIKDMGAKVDYKEDENTYSGRSRYGSDRGYGSNSYGTNSYGYKKSFGDADGYEGDFWLDERPQKDYSSDGYYSDSYSGNSYNSKGYGSSSYGSSQSSYGSSYGSSSYGGNNSRTPNNSYASSAYSAKGGTASQTDKSKYFSPSSTFGTGVKKAQTQATKYTVGCKVRHPKFGIGMVIALKNDGKIVNVAFEKQGIKELSTAIAPLEII